MAPDGGELQRIFAPWRFDYVIQAEEEVAGCIFCAAAEGGEATLTLLREERSFVLLNRYPYTSGHTMIAPVAHVAEIDELSPPELAEIMALANRVVAALRRVYHPHGFNLGLNLGEAAGAGIIHHLHLHVVPRWRGDTNFMSVSGGTRVIPEDLSATYAKVKAALESGDD